MSDPLLDRISRGSTKKLKPIPPGFLTIQQWARQRGKTRASTGVLLRKLVDMGEAEEKDWTIYSGGILRLVKIYKLK